MKLILAILTLGLVASSVHAEKPKDGLLQKADKAVSGQHYGMAGCGLGSVIMGSGTGFNQVFAATSNGTFGTQTFGITSGTSNCDPRGLSASNHKATEFAAANRLGLESDIARGSGENLTALALVMGCKSEKMASNLQKDYGKIFNSAKSNEKAAVEIVEHAEAYCS